MKNIHKINNDFKEEHPKNKSFILVTLFVFHLDITGKELNDEHLSNKHLILVKLFVFHLDILGKEIKP